MSSDFILILPFFLIIALVTGFVLCRMMCVLCSKYSWKGIYMGYCGCILVGAIIALIFQKEIVDVTSVILSNLPLLRNIRI
jgi:hypothetical protein